MNRQFILHLVSTVTLVESAMLLLSGLVGLLYGEKVFLIYFIYALVIGVISYIIHRKEPESNVFYAKEGFVAVGLSWVLLSILGAIPLVLTNEVPSFVNALFEIASGFTTTGASVLSDVESLSHASLFWRSFTHFLGGMGVLVFVLMILPKAGKSGIYVLKAESPGPTVGKIVSKMSNTAKILYLIYTGMTLLEFIILVIFKMPIFDAINAAFQTAGTGGFSIYNAGMGILPIAQQNILTIFMILFGINFNIYYLILIGRAKEGLKSEELRVYFFLILFAAITISINTLSIYGTIKDSLQVAFFQVGSIITTTGFSTVDFDAWPTLSKTILVCLMFVGGCAGSTGGGIKVSRIAMMFKDMVQEMKKAIHPHVVEPVRFEGKVVEKETIYSIRSYISIFAFVFAFSLLLISLNNFDFTTNFTAVAATLNNIGPGLNMVGPTCNYDIFSNFSKLVLTFDMLAGRLEIIPMLVIFSPLAYKRIIK